MRDPLRYTVTEEQIKLLRAASVGWCGDEWGAPEIDPKRPFGNGDYVRDIHRILTGDDDWDAEHDLPRSIAPAEWDALRESYKAKYRSLETALQIVLAAGSFEPGTYERDSHYGRNWRRADG